MDRVRLAPAAIRELAATQTTVGAQAFERGIFPALDEIIRHPLPRPPSYGAPRPPNGTYLGTIYTDGSRTGIHSLERFRQNHRNGEGGPPDWISDMPEAGAWAVLQIAVGAELGCKIRAGCLPCVDGFEADLESATTDKRKHARVQSMVSKAWDDMAAGELTWVPADCTDDETGTGFKANGTPVTVLDTRGKRAADKLAKQAAHTRKVAENIRQTKTDCRKC